MTPASLPKTGFLADASDSLHEMLATQAVDLDLEEGQLLVEQGAPGDAIYALISGRLEVSVLSSDGRKLTLEMLRPGALVGEISLFDPGPRTATVIASTQSRVRRVRSADVMTEIRRRPDLAVDMIRLAGQRMRWMGAQYREQVFLPLSVRLARKILYLTGDGTQTPNTLQLSQTELSEFVGTTREAVSKTLSAWRRLGVVEATRGALVIVDRGALEALAEPDTL